MKFSQTTLLAILATTACVSAAPAAIPTENSLVTRGDANEILQLIEEMKQVNRKRESVSGSENFELSRRAESLATQLVAALASSGIVADVWDTFTQDSTLRTQIIAIVEQTVKAAIVDGPALIKAIWESGLLGEIFKDVLDDSELRSVLLQIAKSIFTTGLNLLKAYKSSSSSSSSTATATYTVETATAVAYTTDSAETTDVSVSDIPTASEYASSSKRDFIDGEYLSKRDVSSIVTTVVDEIKNSGYFESFVKSILADPEKYVTYVSKLLKEGYVLADDVYSWAKSSGLLEKGLEYLEKNGGTYASEIASFLGSEIESGNLTTSDIDSASSSTTATVVETTATASATSTTLYKVRRSTY